MPFLIISSTSCIIYKNKCQKRNIACVGIIYHPPWIISFIAIVRDLRLKYTQVLRFETVRRFFIRPRTNDELEDPRFSMILRVSLHRATLARGIVIRKILLKDSSSILEEDRFSLFLSRRPFASGACDYSDLCAKDTRFEKLSVNYRTAMALCHVSLLAMIKGELTLGHDTRFSHSFVPSTHRLAIKRCRHYCRFIASSWKNYLWENSAGENEKYILSNTWISLSV